MLWIHLIKGIKDKTDDPNFPVQMEIEKGKPSYRSRHYTSAIAILLLTLVLIFFSLRGWEFFVP